MLAYAKVDLIDEMFALRRENAELRRKNADLRSKVAELEPKLIARDQCIAQREADLKARDQRITELEVLIAKLTKKIFGKSSEKMLRPLQEIKKQDGTKADPAKTQKKRKKRDELRKQKARDVEIKHELPEAKRVCPTCHEQGLKFAGQKKTFLIEFVPAHFESQTHLQDTWACPCCDYIVTAPGAQRPTEGGQYGAGFMSHVVVSKCADNIPLNRMEKQFARIGIPMARSTLCKLFHQAANILEPIYRVLEGLTKNSPLVLADETPIPVLDENLTKTRKGYIWTFLTEWVAYYRYSATRSGKTPIEVLGSSSGTLLVDGYTGYNPVTTPECRTRAGCWAHARRYFFDALKTAPIEANHMLAEILELYRVEYEAVQREIAGKAAHTLLRKTKSAPILDRIKQWLIEVRPYHLPTSPLGGAITYAFNQWEPLNHYLTDGKIPIDNNLSERQLRMIATGRKNWMFAGHDDAAQNLAILQSFVTTCTMQGINPEAYLADVLIRVQTHPNKNIEDLLPHRWKSIFAPTIPNSTFELN